jgi:hypothetical protein
MSKEIQDKVQVSEIINTTLESSTGFLGFIITYPDGRIENMILDYNNISFEQVLTQIKRQRTDILKQFSS